MGGWDPRGTGPTWDGTDGERDQRATEPTKGLASDLYAARREAFACRLAFRCSCLTPERFRGRMVQFSTLA